MIKHNRMPPPKGFGDDDVRAHIAAFFAKGGVIQQVPEGVHAQDMATVSLQQMADNSNERKRQKKAAQEVEE